MKKLFVLTFLLTGFCLFAQKGKKLEIVHADDLFFDKTKGNGAKRLVGNVVLKQEKTFMYCDSAYFFSETNSFDAYSNVKVTEGETMSLSGDFLNYDGNTKIGKVRGNIILKDAETVLTTNYLDYYRNENYSTYQNGGKIVNQKDGVTLTSNLGIYYSDAKLFHFKDSVVLVSEDYTIYSDTMHQSNNQNITYFFGPTHIYSDSLYIYCEKGYFDQNKDVAEFVKNAKIINESQLLIADSIFYNLSNEEGKMYCNVEISDTSENFTVIGDYGYHNKKDSISIVTENALLMQKMDNDTFYLHADTLFSTFDSTRQHRLIRAYRKVKFFKPSLAGKCDSLVFSYADSLIKLYYNPVIWADENQLTANYIQIKNYNGKIEWMEMKENSFIITQEDSNKFNQISGFNMFNYFEEGKLRKIDVRKNGKTLYYAKEDNGTTIGVNQATADNLIIILDSNEVRKIKFYGSPKSTLSPLEEVNLKNMFLDGFNWRINEKPKKPEDVFIWE